MPVGVQFFYFYANLHFCTFQVLERIGAKQLTAHLRTFCDYLVIEFRQSSIHSLFFSFIYFFFFCAFTNSFIHSFHFSFFGVYSFINFLHPPIYLWFIRFFDFLYLFIPVYISFSFIHLFISSFINFIIPSFHNLYIYLLIS